MLTNIQWNKSLKVISNSLKVYSCVDAQQGHKMTDKYNLIYFCCSELTDCNRLNANTIGTYVYNFIILSEYTAPSYIDFKRKSEKSPLEFNYLRLILISGLYHMKTLTFNSTHWHAKHQWDGYRVSLKSLSHFRFRHKFKFLSFKELEFLKVTKPNEYHQWHSYVWYWYAWVFSDFMQTLGLYLPQAKVLSLNKRSFSMSEWKKKRLPELASVPTGLHKNHLTRAEIVVE